MMMRNTLTDGDDASNEEKDDSFDNVKGGSI
jgi:hypothetical protein